MGIFAIAWVSLVHVNSWGNVRNVSHKVFVGSDNAGLAEMLHLSDGLALVVIISRNSCLNLVIFSCLLRLGARCYLMILRAEIPNNYLAIKATTSQNIAVFWMELNSSNFDWGLKHVVQSNDVVIGEV